MKKELRFPDIFIPDGEPVDAAFSRTRTTHLGIGPHQDDLDFMALHGILQCFHSQQKWFGGIICTDGAGSVHSGPYADNSPSQLWKIRMQEQCVAATIGHYSFAAQLGFPSKELSHPHRRELIPELTALFGKMKPEVVYTHNPADKHETHLRVLVALLQALKEAPPTHRPKRLWGCEMWHGLDWLVDGDKVILDVGGHGHFAGAAALNGVFDSQIAGGKRYDLAVEGRRRANATLLDAYSGDTLTEASFTLQYVNRLGNDIRHKLQCTLVR